MGTDESSLTSASSPTSVIMAPMMPIVSTQHPSGMEQPRRVFENDKGDDDHDGEMQYSNVDIYGQKHPIETDQKIQNKLRHFDDFLQSRIPDDKKKSVLDAQRKCPELLTDSLKLMFLRCECFNVEVHCYRSVPICLCVCETNNRFTHHSSMPINVSYGSWPSSDMSSIGKNAWKHLAQCMPSNR